MLTRLALGRYEYAPLPKDTSIRLLRVEPGSENEVIRCSLRTADLRESPSFVALSYSWKKEMEEFQYNRHFWLAQEEFLSWFAAAWLRSGLPNGKSLTLPVFLEKLSKMGDVYDRVPNEKGSESERTIVCDGRSMGVQENLFDALLVLRSNMPGDYWIDALCINQSDDEERTVQVQMMDEIYRGATQVIVWLGSLPPSLEPSPDGLDGITKIMQNIAGYFKDVGNEGCSRHVANVQPAKGESGEESAGKLEDKAAAFATIVLFMTRRWWRRLWVVQEYCLAREAVFLFDTYELPFDTVNTFLEGVGRMPGFPMEGLFTNGRGKSERMLHSMKETLQMRQRFQDGKRWTLPEWLQIVKCRKATDVRDALFAGMAVIQPDQLAIDQNLQTSTPSLSISVNSTSYGGKDQKLWKRLHVDYNADTSEVLLNIAACLITNFGWERLFYHTLLFRKVIGQSPASFPLYDQPSWVPDPSSWSSAATEPFIMNRASGVPLPLPDSAFVEEVIPQISRDGATLLLSAAKFDTISQCCTFYFFDEAVAVNDATFQLFDFIANVVPKVYQPTGVSGLKTLSGVWSAVLHLTKAPKEHIDETSALHAFCSFLQGVFKEEQNTGTVSIRDGALNKRKQEVKSAWTKVKEAHPDAPWPGEEAIVKKGNKAPAEEREEAAAGESKEKPAGEPARKHFRKIDNTTWNPAFGRYSVFLTHSGYLGLGPSSIQENDQIFMIVEGKTPYVFRDIENVFRTREAAVTRELEQTQSWAKTSVAKVRDASTLSNVYTKIDKRNIENLEAELNNIQERRGEISGWQLLGEAYVEGVMNGEVAETMAQRIQKHNFV